MLWEISPLGESDIAAMTAFVTSPMERTSAAEFVCFDSFLTTINCSIYKLELDKKCERSVHCNFLR